MEEVVIAGMSGKLPESENLQEFWANLISGVDMVTDDDRRWKAGEWATRSGTHTHTLWPHCRPGACWRQLPWSSASSLAVR